MSLRSSLRPSRGPARVLGALLLLLALLSCRKFDRLLRGRPSQPELPAAPAPLAMPSGEPAQQARALVDALEEPKQRLAAWMRVYAAAQVPVYDAAGSGIGQPGADTPGPYFWNVWLASAMEKKAVGVRIADAGAILGITLPGADGNALARALLEDLRSNAKRGGPAALLTEIVRERVRRGRSRVDVLDPKVGIDAMIDLPTLQLLAWVSFRGALALASAQGNKSGWLEPGTPGPAEPGSAPWVPASPADFSLVPEARAATEEFNCKELLGNATVTKWVSGVLKFFGGGGSLVLGTGEKVSLPKTSELMAKLFGATRDQAKMVGSVTSSINAVTSAITTYLMIHALSMRIESSPDILERSKTRDDGKTQTHRIQIVFDTTGMPDGKNVEACLTSFGLNAFGVSFKLPENEKPLPGVGVQFKEGTGFDRVLWGDYKQLKQDADAEGFVNLTILGRAQKRDLPASAKPWELEYSFFVESQPEQEDLGSIANMLWSSLKAAASMNPVGLAGPILQVAKVMHYSLGEQPFTVRDWKPPGWTVSGSQDEAVFSGQVCDLEREFRLRISGGLSGWATYHPDKHYPASGGRYDYSGSYEGGTAYGNGTYTLSGDPWTSLVLTQSGVGCVTHPLGRNCAEGEEVLKLTVAETCSK